MTAFDVLQSRFIAQEVSAFGLSGQSVEILQPPAVMPAGDDAALWDWFNAIPADGAIYTPSGSDFFTAYSAVIGALIAGSGPLDPVAAAQKRLADWGAAPPSWSMGYAGMSRALATAPNLRFGLDSAPGPGPGFWGLVGGPPPPPDPSEIFSGGEVRATVACAHLLTFAPQPGDWYVSSALSLAYRTPRAPPWNPASPVTWDTAFGPNGTLQRMLAALIIVSGLDAAATSTAAFGPAGQKLIKAGAAAGGAWPYYLPAAAANTGVSFDREGRLSLVIRSQGKTPIALAAVVQSASSYLGS